MKEVYLPHRTAWRQWLAENHDQIKDGIWLVFYRKGADKPSLNYGESVEEALCFGWIDSVIKRIDDAKYCRKFTPRKDNSNWSETNKKRVQKVIREGRMTEFGLAKVRAAKRLGTWNSDPRTSIDSTMPQELMAALAQNLQAKNYFDRLAPSHQKHYGLWIASAKKPETRARRLAQALEMLIQGQKLGLK